MRFIDYIETEIITEAVDLNHQQDAIVSIKTRQKEEKATLEDLGFMGKDLIRYKGQIEKGTVPPGKFEKLPVLLWFGKSKPLL